MEQARPLSVRDKLERLERERAGLTADALLDIALDILAERGRDLSPDAVREFNAVVATLLTRASAPARRKAARRLDRWAAVGDEPRPARLGPAAMLALLREGAPKEIRRVVVREALTEEMTTLLLLRGDRPAVLRAAGNRHARFTRAGLASLAEAAASDRRLRSVLVRRADLGDEVVDWLWPRLDIAERADLILAGLRLAPAEAAEIVGEAERAQPEGEELVRRGDLAALARQVGGIARAAGVAPALALALLCGAYERGFVLVAGAAELEELSFLDLTCARAALSGARTAPQRLLRAFRECAAEDARAVLAEAALRWGG